MEITYYILGMFTIVFVTLVLGVLKMNEKLRSLEDNYDNLESTVEICFREITRNSDNLSRRIDEVENNYYRSNSEVYKYVDSRFEKFENNVVGKELLKETKGIY